MNLRKRIIITLTSLLGTSFSFAGEAKTDFNTTAQVEKTCLLKSGDINFGILQMPLTSQTSSAMMKVLCSNNTPYSLDLTYGGKYYIQGLHC